VALRALRGLRSVRGRLVSGYADRSVFYRRHMPSRPRPTVQFTGTSGPVVAKQYDCAWCGAHVASVVGMDAWDPAADPGVHARGLSAPPPTAHIRLCPQCGYPTFIDFVGNVIPALPHGENVNHLPEGVDTLYDEARACVSVGASHAAVMVCRKILMHVAVLKGAPENQSFVQYVDYLVDSNFVPPNTREWVDEIRQVGNDANHEISVIQPDEARAVLEFVSMLLKLLYEYPARGAASVAVRAARDAGAVPPAPQP
jgi:hypothetical protein